MKIKTLIVDDEPLARERLRSLLSREADIEIIGEAANGVEALERIERDAPQLVFLDIQMPEMGGFDVLENLGPEQRPLVIFVTAYDKFALKAFEVHALDYLLKPFDRERFESALSHARERIQQSSREDLSQKLTALLSDVAQAKGPAKPIERIAVKTEGRVLLFKIDDIDWVESADNYVNLHIGNESHLHRETLSALEAKLPPEQFLRISRSTIVNVERVKELQPMFHGDYVVILRNGTKLSLSRSFREKLNQLLGKAD